MGRSTPQSVSHFHSLFELMDRHIAGEKQPSHPHKNLAAHFFVALLSPFFLSLSLSSLCEVLGDDRFDTRRKFLFHPLLPPRGCMLSSHLRCGVKNNNKKKTVYACDSVSLSGNKKSLSLLLLPLCQQAHTLMCERQQFFLESAISICA